MSGIFIGYRRNDSADIARRLYGRLEHMLHEHQMFMDVDSIPPGANFPEVIDQSLRECDVFLAVIGKQWLIDKNDNRRLDHPEDFLRYEIATALGRPEIRVIPLLVDEATIPEEKDLPVELAKLCKIQVWRIRNLSFEEDVNRLGDFLQKHLWKIKSTRRMGRRVAVPTSPVDVPARIREPWVESLTEDVNLPKPPSWSVSAEEKSDPQVLQIPPRPQSPAVPRPKPAAEEEKERAKQQLEYLAQERTRMRQGLCDPDCCIEDPEHERLDLDYSQRSRVYTGLLLRFEANYGEVYDPWGRWSGESANQTPQALPKVSDTEFEDAMDTLTEAISREYRWNDYWELTSTFPQTLGRIAQACRLLGASGRSQALLILENLSRFEAFVDSFDVPDGVYREYEVGGGVRDAAHFALLHQLRLNANERSNPFLLASLAVSNGAYEGATEILAQTVSRECRWDGDWEPMTIHKTLGKIAQACRLLGASGRSQTLPILEKLTSFEAHACRFGCGYSMQPISSCYHDLSSWYHDFSARHSYAEVGEPVREAAHFALLDNVRSNIEGFNLYFGLKSEERPDP